MLTKSNTSRTEQVKDEDIKHRWQEYFEKPFNGETESSTIELDDSFNDTS
jgi:hypothetical protein